MATLSVPNHVPPVSEDCEQLRKAFEGFLSFFLSISHLGLDYFWMLCYIYYIFISLSVWIAGKSYWETVVNAND